MAEVVLKMRRNSSLPHVCQGEGERTVGDVLDQVAVDVQEESGVEVMGTGDGDVPGLVVERGRRMWFWWWW